MDKWVRDALVLVVVLGLVLGGLGLYTRVWPPAVIVESGSMMHPDAQVRYGRLGTIDPGDLVLVKAAPTEDAITTLVEGGRDRYGLPGDVIVYHPANARDATPVIHRAVAYVEARADGYDVRWGDAPCEGGARKLERDGRAWCRYDEDGITIAAANLHGYAPAASGFLTKGDNPATNRLVDQMADISRDASGRPVPVPMEWVKGKARGELPWLGLLKLALAGKQNQRDPPESWVKVGSAFAPKDLWVMLAISLAVLLGGPTVYDMVRARAKRRDR